MAGSVLDNKSYRCLGCGYVVEGAIEAASIPECPDCGGVNFEQIAVTIVCDFCSIPLARDDVDEFWTHYAHEHALPPPAPGMRPTIQDPEWAACGECHRLIESGDAEALLDRAVTHHATLHPEVPRHVLRLAVQVPHAGFWAHIDTEREPHRGFATSEGGAT